MKAHLDTYLRARRGLLTARASGAAELLVPTRGTSCTAKPGQRGHRHGDSRRAPHGTGTPKVWDPWAAEGGQHRSAPRCGQDSFVWRWGTAQDASPSLQRSPSLGGRSRSEHPLVVFPCFRARQHLSALGSVSTQPFPESWALGFSRCF